MPWCPSRSTRGRPVGDVGGLDGEDADGVWDLCGGGRGDGDGRADAVAHVDAVPGDRPQPEHVCEVGAVAAW